jgi:peptide/nickel transport system permease protein
VSTYVLRRLAISIPLLLVFSFIMYLALYKAGDPLARFRQVPGLRAEDLQRIIELNHLDEPWYSGYWGWLKGFVTGDWGTSAVNPANTATEEIARRLPATFELLGGALIVSTIIGAFLGIFSALRRYSGFDYSSTAFAYLGYAMPTFLLGLFLQMFAIWMKDNGWAIIPFVAGLILILATVFHARRSKPALVTCAIGLVVAVFSLVFWDRFGGDGELVFYTQTRFSPGNDSIWTLDHFRHLVLPVVTLSVISIAGWSRYQRSAMLDVLNADYLRTARAKGLPERTVVGRHALRNAMLPLITVMAIDIAALFSGAVITEQVFAWPGIGTLFLGSAFDRNVPVAMGIVMIGAIVVVVFNLLADVAYSLADPRIRLA